MEKESEEEGDNVLVEDKHENVEVTGKSILFDFAGDMVDELACFISLDPSPLHTGLNSTFHVPNCSLVDSALHLPRTAYRMSATYSSSTIIPEIPPSEPNSITNNANQP